MPQTLVLEDVVASAMDVALQGMWTAMPGTVESYDSTLQRANIQIAVKVANIAESGARALVKIAVINAVPVVHAGGGGFRAVYPIARGDTVLVVFATRSIDTWLAKGGVVDPHFDHHHDISDAIAISGLRDFAHPLKNVPTDRASMGYDTGATIEFRQHEIRIGSDTGTQPTLMGTSYRSAETAFFSALDALVLSLSVFAAALALAAPTLTNVAPGVIPAFTTAAGAVATAATAFTGAVTTFNAGSATYLTTVATVI